jgi:deazaflavin-dependent oxidoreductase (nitroreductase family)
VSAIEDLPFCYLTSKGRRTGRDHEIEIWFGLSDDTVYLLSGGGDRSDWVKNLRREPRVRLRLGDRTHAGSARIVSRGSEEDALARSLLLEKYASGYAGDLSSWGRTALAVAIDLEGVS